MAALLVLLTVAFYWPALHNGFIWDDDMHLTKNPRLHDLAGLASLWTTSAARLHRGRRLRLCGRCTGLPNNLIPFLLR